MEKHSFLEKLALGMPKKLHHLGIMNVFCYGMCGILCPFGSDGKLVSVEIKLREVSSRT